VIWGEYAATERSELKGFFDDDAAPRLEWEGMGQEEIEVRLYRLCVGVTNFCGVRLTDLEGVKALVSLRFFFGVFGTSSSSLGSHCPSQLLQTAGLNIQGLHQ